MTDIDTDAVLKVLDATRMAPVQREQLIRDLCDALDAAERERDEWRQAKDDAIREWERMLQAVERERDRWHASYEEEVEVRSCAEREAGNLRVTSAEDLRMVRKLEAERDDLRAALEACASVLNRLGWPPGSTDALHLTRAALASSPGEATQTVGEGEGLATAQSHSYESPSPAGSPGEATTYEQVGYLDVIVNSKGEFVRYDHHVWPNRISEKMPAVYVRVATPPDERRWYCTTHAKYLTVDEVYEANPMGRFGTPMLFHRDCGDAACGPIAAPPEGDEG